ncbi:MFS transporter [Brachybacterium kimchii]|uniref:MFS transporter n=1 Tax=Brachybacterium kimchii TaxID=2942909 RepID=A0ABY4NAN8_9MICO|nr:MFS transporter [Brachybacterium kimchii]UQN30440.1 MFS transporter [Brachybacterium kimchii]
MRSDSRTRTAVRGGRDGGGIDGGESTADTRADAPMFMRLVAMMLLQFMVFGSWFATFGLVLVTNGLGSVIGLAYSLAAVAAIVSPMFLGAIADRFLASQKALGIAHLCGAAVMLLLPSVVTAANGALALGLIFLYMVFFQPTLGLVNSIGLRHLGGNEKLFPYMRVFGTLGWVLAGVGVGALGLSASTHLFYVTAATSFVYGIYAFSLPSTPAPAKGVRFTIGDIVGARAFKLLKSRNFLTLIICAVLTAIALGVYNSYASPFLGALGITNVAGVLAVGQAAEVAFILTIPWVVKHVGMKWALFAGMVMWGMRFLVFIAAGLVSSTGLAILGVALQGICNDFFLVLAAMYIGEVVPVKYSAQAQSMLILAVSGVGQLIGSLVSGEVFGATVGANQAATAADWTPVLIIPVFSAAITAVVWAVFFHDARRDSDSTKPAPLEVGP